MKRFILAIGLLCTAICNAQTPADLRADSLLRCGDYFTLDSMLARTETTLSPAVRLRAAAMTDARFRRFERSNDAIATLLNNPATDASWQEPLVGQLLSNFRMSGDNASAAALYKQLWEMDADTANRASHAKVHSFFAGQAALPATRLERPEAAVEIPFRIDSTGRGFMLRIDVEIGGSTESFIFDTGCAEMSFASEAFARSHGIRPTGISLDINGVTGSGSGWLGIADSLCIGPMTLHNALFAITPTMPIDSVYRVEAVLGCNFMLRAGVIEFHAKERIIRFPAKGDTFPAGRPNMLMEGNGLFYIRAEADGNPVLLQFDSGNTKSSFSPVYFEKHREEIEATCSEKTFKTGGFSGIVEGRCYVKPAVEIRIGRHPVILRNTQIATDLGLSHETGEDGSLGADFLTACDCVRVDYGAMRISVTNRELPEASPGKGDKQTKTADGQQPPKNTAATK